MAYPVIFGDPSSIFVRGILIALAEKGMPYGLAAESELPLANASERLAGEIVIEHGGFVLGGADSILRYIDEAFPGPQLQAEAPRQRARMNRALEIHFGEAAPILGSEIVGRNLASALTGEWTSSSLPESVETSARRTLSRMTEVLANGPFFAGDMFSLADAAVAPLFAYFMPLPEADALIAPASPLRAWWRRLVERESFRSTRPASGFFATLRPSE